MVSMYLAEFGSKIFLHISRFHLLAYFRWRLTPNRRLNPLMHRNRSLLPVLEIIQLKCYSTNLKVTKKFQFFNTNQLFHLLFITLLLFFSFCLFYFFSFVLFWKIFFFTFQFLYFYLFFFYFLCQFIFFFIYRVFFIFRVFFSFLGVFFSFFEFCC